MKETLLESQISLLEPYLEGILKAKSAKEKLKLIDTHPAVQEFLKQNFLSLSSKYDLVIHSIIAIGQGVNVLNLGKEEHDKEKLIALLDQLLEVEKFYEPIGGILGYHLMVLKLICGKKSKKTLKYRKPTGFWINEDLPIVRNLVREGLEKLSSMAEIYPVGGAGDRLDLKHEVTQEPLPAACLLFDGISLLETLVRDLQAREYLHYKLFNKQATTPVAMMTSHEKNNYQHIMEICEKLNWFGRSKQDFHFFIQPLAPVITREGQWSTSGPYKLTMKPG